MMAIMKAIMNENTFVWHAESDIDKRIKGARSCLEGTITHNKFGVVSLFAQILLGCPYKFKLIFTYMNKTKVVFCIYTVFIQLIT